MSSLPVVGAVPAVVILLCRWHRPYRWSLSHRCYPHRSSPLSSVRSFIVVIPSVVGAVPHRCHPELDSGSILAFGANSTVLGKGRCEILNQVQDDNDGGGVNDREG